MGNASKFLALNPGIACYMHRCNSNWPPCLTPLSCPADVRRRGARLRRGRRPAGSRRLLTSVQDGGRLCRLLRGVQQGVQGVQQHACSL